MGERERCSSKDQKLSYKMNKLLRLTVQQSTILNTVLYTEIFKDSRF